MAVLKKVFFLQKQAEMCACVQALTNGERMSPVVNMYLPHFADWYIGTTAQEGVVGGAECSCGTPEIRCDSSQAIKLFYLYHCLSEKARIR